MTRWLALVATLMLAIAGCGGDNGANVSDSLAAYLGKPYKVGSCSDAQYEQAGAHLWKCQVTTLSSGDPWVTWNVAVKNDRIIDASPA